MPFKAKHVEKAFELIDKSEIRKTVKETVKGASIFGVSVFTCSLLLGPVGAIVGGIVGGVTTGIVCSEFDSLSYVWKNKLNYDQREKILEEINKATEDVSVEDAYALFQYFKDNPKTIVIVLNLLSFYGINVSPIYRKLL